MVLETGEAAVGEVDEVARAEELLPEAGEELVVDLVGELAAVEAERAAAEEEQRAERKSFRLVPRPRPSFSRAKRSNSKVIVEPHRHAGVFVGRGKEDLLLTKNLTPGESVYGEKRISISNTADAVNGSDAVATTTEYRVWNPFRSKLAAAILGGVDDIYMRPGSKVLYLGAASGTSVSHVADIVGPEGTVYAVEFSHRSGRDLINMATHRTNVIPIVEDARHPLKYRMLLPMVDCIFADVAQPGVYNPSIR